MLRNLYIDILIRIIERVLYATPVKKTLDEDRMQTFYATLFDLPGFRQYCIERETRFLHFLANQNTELVKGQRLENALLFSKAMRASEKKTKRDTLTGAPNKALPRAQSSPVSPTSKRAVTN